LALFDGLDEIYHRAKFGEDRTTRAGCTFENMLLFAVYIDDIGRLQNNRIGTLLCMPMTFYCWHRLLRHYKHFCGFANRNWT